ncbi:MULTISPECIES: hypothetical protein [unclassified Streptomyces]|uniref:hypothetical protein n=1 Tax=unclassified Streptomyces TaxID=2593676 RepID=UPI000DC780E1|nr:MULTISPECIES: hypothetical protein [unclassified Streptomyces]AWZ07885.1 hypothetical protein DRB89_28395 [Streptomyces sp. ICC4]AWZ15538.1 hypothetical protein DRB96_28415 [Streptomyces sp. ICC1]
MNRLALLAAGTAGLAVFAITPASATAQSASTVATVISCGHSGLQAGLSTRVCAAVTGNSVEFYGTVGLAGPPSPGSPAPAPKELITTLSAEVVGSTATPSTQTKSVIFTLSNLEVHGLVTTVPCGSTIHGTFGAASFPRPANPVAHEVTITC